VREEGSLAALTPHSTVGRRSARLALALVCGVVLALAFPPYGAWVLAPAAVAGLSLLARDARLRDAVLVGLGAGTAFFLVLLGWLQVIGPDAWVALSVIEAAFIALLAAGLSLTARLPGWPVWQAALWVGEELARDRLPFGGFPWGRLAFSQSASPFRGLAAAGGAPLVSFAVALTGTLAAAVVLTVRRHPRRGALAALSAAVVAGSGLLVPLTVTGSRTATVAVVQGNVPRTGLDFLGQREAVLRNHVRATRELAAGVRAGTVAAPDLVLWPENASDVDPFADPQARRLISSAVTEVGVPTLVGAVVAGPDAQHLRNEGVVWSPRSGPGQTYVKRHPVPFGEYLPFRSLLSRWITRFQRIPRDFAAGDAAGVLDVGPARLGDLLCFEIAYDGLVRDTVTGGGQAVVVQTNNATYGRTGQPEQQLAMSRLRAVEHGRTFLVAATSGISAILAPDGTLVAQLPEFTAGTLVRPVPLRSSLTLADRLGAGPEWVLALAGLAALLVGLRRRTRAGGRRGTPADALAGPTRGPTREPAREPA